jgi:hypothetical protein
MAWSSVSSTTASVPRSSTCLRSFSRAAPDNPAGAEEPGGLHRELARCAACPEDQHCLAGPEVAAVARPGWTKKAARPGPAPGRPACRRGRAGRPGSGGCRRRAARPLPSRRRSGLEPAERELVVRDRDVERVQGRRGPGAHRPALARLRIGELVKGRRGAGLAECSCSPLFLRWMIGRVVAIHEDRLTGGDRDFAQRGRRSPSHLRAAAAQMTAPA